MKVKIQQFLFNNTLTSWEKVGQSLGREIIKLGHDVHFIPTDGINKKFIPNDLAPYIKLSSNENYNLGISYTAPHNMPRYLNNCDNKFGIWNYDGAPKAPPEEVRYIKYCDRFCPSSNFSKQVFLNSGASKNNMVVIPHGIDLDQFENKNKYNLKTDKKYKILYNISTPHVRKNIINTLKAFGKAFTKDDDVCLVIKVSTPKCNTRADVPKPQSKNKKIKRKNRGKKIINVEKSITINFWEILNDFKKKYKNHAEIEIISGYIPSLIELYNACDIVFMMSHMEMWWLPGIEGFAAGKLVIASNYGGQLHYLNNDNSLLIDGKVVRMPKHYQYWNPSPYAEMFEPNVDDAVEKLRYAIDNYDGLIKKFEPSIIETINQFTWENVTKQLLSYVR